MADLVNEAGYLLLWLFVQVVEVHNLKIYALKIPNLSFHAMQQ